MTSEYLKSHASYIALEQLGHDIDSLQTAEESLRTFYSLLDFFGRLANNLKTYLLKGFKSFKRSELHAYMDAHRIIAGRFLKDRNADFKDVRVPIPDGLTGTYASAATLVETSLKTASFPTVIDSTLAYLALYDTKSVDEYESLTTETAFAVKQITKTDKDALEEWIRENFIDKHTPDPKPAYQVIGDHKSLLMIHSQILGFEKNYFDAQKAVKAIDQIEKKIDLIIKRLKGLRSIDATYLKNFHAFVLTLAIQMDTYGALLDYAQRIEHNYVLALRTLINEHKDR